MEEPIYNYFFKLVAFSSTNSLLLIINSLIEIDTLLPSFVETPAKIKEYLSTSQTNIFYHNIIELQKFSLYYQFQKLRNSTTLLYPLSFIFIFIAIMILFLVLFFIMTYHKPQNKTTNAIKINFWWKITETIIINLYAHIIFRHVL